MHTYIHRIDNRIDNRIDTYIHRIDNGRRLVKRVLQSLKSLANNLSSRNLKAICNACCRCYKLSCFVQGLCCSLKLVHLPRWFSWPYQRKTISFPYSFYYTKGTDVASSILEVGERKNSGERMLTHWLSILPRVALACLRNLGVGSVSALLPFWSSKYRQTRWRGIMTNRSLTWPRLYIRNQEVVCTVLISSIFVGNYYWKIVLKKAR